MNNKLTPSILLTRSNKGTSFQSFLKVVKYLQSISISMVLRLSKRFNINPDLVTLFISVCRMEGVSLC